jgi:hypothetical protein
MIARFLDWLFPTAAFWRKAELDMLDSMIAEQKRRLKELGVKGFR